MQSASKYKHELMNKVKPQKYAAPKLVVRISSSALYFR